MSDEQLATARELVIQAGTGSTNRLARDLGVQYPHARRLMDQLEIAGTVSPPNRDGSRQLLAPKQHQ